MGSRAPFVHFLGRHSRSSLASNSSTGHTILSCLRASAFTRRPQIYRVFLAYSYVQRYGFLPGIHSPKHIDTLGSRLCLKNPPVRRTHSFFGGRCMLIRV
jgi:hypothetical protein